MKRDKSAVFYKIYNNLGISGIPYRQKERGDGVYYGPDAVLGEDFLKGFPARAVYSYSFPKSGETDKKDVFAVFASESKKCADKILSGLREGDTLFAVGGDNSIVFPVLLSDIGRFGIKNIGILFFDTHGDIHARSTSPSGNFHGMYLRPFFDRFDAPEIDKLVPEKLTGNDIVYFGGGFEHEKEEEEFIERLRIKRFSKNEIRNDSGMVKKELNDFLNAHPHAHINFDIDVFDESLVWATGMPSKEGLLENDVFPLLEIISRHPSKTVTLSELNPEKKGRDEAVKVAREVLTALRGGKN
ncbi:MAG: arginase family protein [Candidatus Liptonbacteria bacterium]|nr:arginase family protein [Candidatus Liptonbacteria bacterium]